MELPTWLKYPPDSTHRGWKLTKSFWAIGLENAKMSFQTTFPHFFAFFVIRENIFGDFNRQIWVFIQKGTSDIFGLKWPQDLRVPHMEVRLNMLSTENYDGFHFVLLSFSVSERINGVISEMIPGEEQYSSPYTKFNREKPQGPSCHPCSDESKCFN